MNIRHVLYSAVVVMGYASPVFADSLRFYFQDGPTSYSFDLPSSSTPSGFITDGPITGIYYSDVSVSRNGVSSLQDVGFFDSSSFGGVLIASPGQGAEGPDGLNPVEDTEGMNGKALFKGTDANPYFNIGSHALADSHGEPPYFFLTISPLSNPTPTVTPEPTSIALLGTGLLSLAGVVRRRLA